ncbi:MAG: addiction module protein [Thermoanaerobaculia bacterium]|nr:addiction module protein [Thermoanaerobaculia bacterium]
MSSPNLASILALPVAERLELVQAIWDSVAQTPDSFPLSEAERNELDQRLEDYRRNPDAVSPWAEVKARILARA